MTRALIIYESLFGDARTVAHAIARGLSAFLETDVRAVADTPPEIGADVGLLVVGGPNHAFGMPRRSTREAAVTQHGAVVADTTTGLHEWLQSARVLHAGLAAAAFDTRSSGHPVVTKLDHAARSEEKLLGRIGATTIAPAEHFFVVDTTGPLVDGEENRARNWGKTLGELAASRAAR